MQQASLEYAGALLAGEDVRARLIAASGDPAVEIPATAARSAPTRSSSAAPAGGVFTARSPTGSSAAGRRTFSWCRDSRQPGRPDLRLQEDAGRLGRLSDERSAASSSRPFTAPSPLPRRRSLRSLTSGPSWTRTYNSSRDRASENLERWVVRPCDDYVTDSASPFKPLEEWADAEVLDELEERHAEISLDDPIKALLWQLAIVKLSEHPARHDNGVCCRRVSGSLRRADGVVRGRIRDALGLRARVARQRKRSRSRGGATQEREGCSGARAEDRPGVGRLRECPDSCGGRDCPGPGSA